MSYLVCILNPCRSINSQAFNAGPVRWLMRHSFLLYYSVLKQAIALLEYLNALVEGYNNATKKHCAVNLTYIMLM